MAEPTTQVPRDDRAWPRGAFVVSVVLVLAGVGTAVVVAAASRDRGRVVPWVSVTGFAVAAICAAVVYAADLRAWMRGQPHPGAIQALMLAITLAVLALFFRFDSMVGGSMLAGVVSGMAAANAWAIRSARANREVVDQAEVALAREREAAHAEQQPLVEPAMASQPAPVGRVLHDQMALQRRQAFAWMVAGALATLACVAVQAQKSVTVVVAITAAGSLLLVLRRLWTTSVALRDFTRAAAPDARRAYVVLVDDPAPKLLGALLAVWSEPPETRAGRIPEPESVYRCDDALESLTSVPGDVVVHEAWVGTGGSRWSRPHWIAADAGIALPHRRAVLGRWLVGALMGGEHPDRPRPLTIPSPRPDSAMTIEREHDVPDVLAAVGGRLLGLVLIGLLVFWLA